MTSDNATDVAAPEPTTTIGSLTPAPAPLEGANPPPSIQEDQPMDEMTEAGSEAGPLPNENQSTTSHNPIGAECPANNPLPDVPNPWVPRKSYAGAVISKGSAPTAEDDPDDDDDDDDLIDERPGPIKGFDSKKVFLNLNRQVQRDWELKASSAIFVHHLDGGHGPGLAANVKPIRDAICRIHKEEYEGEAEADLNPIVTHPTAAVQPRRNHRGAPPYLFFVTNLPREFREFLVKTAVFQIESNLKTLFFEKADPIPHDFVVTLKNYNMPVESEREQELAYIRCFLYANRDNLPPPYTEEQVQSHVRNSIRVELLQIIVPTTKALTPVYNVYIFPPTKVAERLEKWRKGIAKQTFFTDYYGVGERYERTFNCIHCKSVDHPGGLCPYAKGSSNDVMDDSDDDFIPTNRGKAPQKPTLNPPHPSNRGNNRNAGPSQSNRGNTRPNKKPSTSGTTQASKKRKLQ